MAARGDLYVEVDRPHLILNAMEKIIKADPNAIAASRMLNSLKNTVEPVYERLQLLIRNIEIAVLPEQAACIAVLVECHELIAESCRLKLTREHKAVIRKPERIRRNIQGRHPVVMMKLIDI